jgi:hypothetical protein
MIKVTLTLTPEQLEAAQPLIAALATKQGAIFGQAFLVPTSTRNKFGSVDLYYLTAMQYAHINPALMEAMKMEKEQP